MKTKLKLNQWSDYFFNLNVINSKNIITDKQITLAIDSFKKNIFSQIDQEHNLSYNELSTNEDPFKLLIIFKIKTINNQIRSISYMQTINFQDIDQLKQLFIEFWNLRSEDYFLAEISYIIFTYKIVTENLRTKILKSNIITDETTYKSNINDKELPRINQMSFGRTLPFGVQSGVEW